MNVAFVLMCVAEMTDSCWQVTMSKMNLLGCLRMGPTILNIDRWTEIHVHT